MMAGASDFTCAFDGCIRTAEDGALLRISPRGKGMPFIGMCLEHYRLVADEFAELDRLATPAEPASPSTDSEAGQ